MPRKEIIASVGAGRMGRGIAITFALAGYEVRMLDVKKRASVEFDALQRTASEEIKLTLDMLSSIGILSAEAIDSTIARVSYFAKHNTEGALADASLIFEAVPETLDAKEASLKLISKYASPSAIVASTTSTILSDDLQPFVSHPARFLNAHWLNPAFLIPLVEVSPGKNTDPEIVLRLNTLLEKIGKVPVVCAASPGYIVPRIQALAMNEAARMVEEGVASVEDIDKATKYGFGFRFAILGLLEFIDWGGGDILFHASRYMTNAMQDERYASPAIVASNMHEGRIGLKTQQGFLDYSSIDINAYQQQKLSEFVALLRHIDKLPPSATDNARTATTYVTESSDVRTIVKQYLQAIDRNDAVSAQVLLHQDFSSTYPDGHLFKSSNQQVEWSQKHYQSITRTHERIDVCQSENETAVYCYGTLSGLKVDGTPFSGVRCMNRFVLADGLIRSQLTWND